MLGNEQLKKIRSIEFATRRLLDDLMSGGYRSSFKGQGVQFSEHRVYVPGDDIRHIDWKVSARTREPLVKKFEEERELSVLLVVDASASLAFGSGERLKGDTAAEVAGMLAYAAAMSGDKTGLLLFSEDVEKVLPLRKGKSHVSRILKELMEHRPKSKKTRISQALDSAGRVMKHKGIIVIVSDFIDDAYDVSLRRLARRHDVIVIQVYDQLEKSLPQTGFIRLSNPETGETQVVHPGTYAFKKWLESFHVDHQLTAESAWKSGGVEALKIDTAEDSAEAIVKFFNARARWSG